ncbi:hypothetical protein [Mycobacterium sp.]|uniref:hypothetical protein n=1 Tax=Mycobacterium sp. TaxID=1785 RepID=UPI002CD9BF76|nr:hypothetical protein [Mycobacterium sp.]HTQ17152.1 hypothetical protein [Mycobacterium sp.]
MPEAKSSSPGGRYLVSVDPFEAGPYRWVETPELLDTAVGRVLLALKDPYWHLDSADWQGESEVALHLRHYPDGQTCVVAIDCVRLTACIDGTDPGRLGHLGDSLQRVL